MSELGRAVSSPCNVYFVGGVTAVVYGWRETTVDVDMKVDPDVSDVLRAIPAIKERLGMNVEIAAPDDFIPELPGWRERSIFIRREGRVSFLHYDPYAQALSKIERGHEQDRADVARMMSERLVESGRLLELYGRIEPELFRFPAIDPRSFRRAVEEAAALH